MNLPQEAIDPKGPTNEPVATCYDFPGGPLSSLWIDSCIYPGCVQKGKLLTFLPHNEANQKVLCYLKV